MNCKNIVFWRNIYKTYTERRSRANNFRAASQNGNAVVVIITRFTKNLPHSASEIELQAASQQGSLRHIENPTHIIMYIPPFLVICRCCF